MKKQKLKKIIDGFEKEILENPSIDEQAKKTIEEFRQEQKKLDKQSKKDKKFIEKIIKKVKDEKSI